MPEPDLSLAAETLLLAIDPGRGGLLARNRRRFRKAVSAAHRVAQGGSGRPHAWAIAQARGELAHAGLIVSGRPFAELRLTDTARAARRFQDLRRGLLEGDLSDPRDQGLAALLAWSGILAGRLSRDEWRIAVRRLRGMAATPAGRAPLSAQQRMTEGVLALGAVAFGASDDWLSEIGSGDFGGGDGGFGSSGGDSGGGY